MKRKISALQTKLYDIDAEAISMFKQVTKDKVIAFEGTDYPVEIRDKKGEVQKRFVDHVQYDLIYFKYNSSYVHVEDLANTDDVLMLLTEIIKRIN